MSMLYHGMFCATECQNVAEPQVNSTQIQLFIMTLYNIKMKSYMCILHVKCMEINKMWPHICICTNLLQCSRDSYMYVLS